MTEPEVVKVDSWLVTTLMLLMVNSPECPPQVRAIEFSALDRWCESLLRRGRVSVLPPDDETDAP